MTRPGRPYVGPQHNIRCAPAEWAAVDRLAALNGLSRSAQARQLIRLGLAAVRIQATPENGPTE